MNKTWEQLIIYADTLGLEFEFRNNVLTFFSREEKIGELSQCKPAGWILNSQYGSLQGNQPKRLINRVRDIA
jgi:hypothetical protein